MCLDLTSQGFKSLPLGRIAGDQYIVETHYRFPNRVDQFDIPGCQEFVKLADFPAARGQLMGSGYNYNFNAHKFCRKVFAQIDAAAEEGVEKLIWLDADIEFRDRFEIPEWDGFLAYLGRPEWHTCASFIGWDLTHEQSAQWFEAYWRLYVTGTIFALSAWTDCHALDWLRSQMQFGETNLAEGLELKGPANVFDEVFGPVAHHKKGNLKKPKNRYVELIEMIAERKPSKILEIGVWNGVRAIEMCQWGAEYVGFDLFEDATDETDSEEMNVKAHHTVDEVYDRLTTAGVTASLVKGNTRDTLPGCGYEGFDFAFIDGGHSVETIQSDWENVRKMMKPGGMVVFDDYYEGGIDTEKFGCNKIVEDLPFSLSQCRDPVAGGGVTRLAFVEL